MITPYLLHFDVPCNLISEQLPENLDYRLTTATNTLHYSFDGAYLAMQQLNLHPFYVELFELDTGTPFSFHLEVTSPQYFLFFMLEGQARFTTPEGFYLNQPPKGHMALCHKTPGHYRVTLPADRHIACCVTLEPGWLNYATEKLPAFHRHQETHPPLSHPFLPYVRIDSFLHRRLQEVLTLKRNGHGRLDGFLRLKFADILEYYSPAAEERQCGLAYKVKKYLSEHLTDPNINYRNLSILFDVGERALRYHFQQEFGISIHQFLTHKRLQLAHHLIIHKGMLISDVYLQAGYQDESTFRRAYHNFFKSRRKSDV